MKTLLRVAALAAVALTVHATQTWWLARIQPDISASQAIQQLNGDATDAAAVRWFETEKNLLEVAGAAALVAAAVLLFQQPLRRALMRIPRRGTFVVPQLAWEKFSGQSWEEHRGFGWVNALHSEDREAVKEIWEAAKQARSLYEARGRLWHGPSHHTVDSSRGPHRCSMPMATCAHG